MTNKRQFVPRKPELISYADMPKKEQETLLLRNVYELLDLYVRDRPYGDRLQQAQYAAGVYALDNRASSFGQALLGACHALDHRPDAYAMLETAVDWYDKRGFMLGLDVLEKVAENHEPAEVSLNLYLNAGLAKGDPEVSRRVLEILDSKRRSEHGL